MNIMVVVLLGLLGIIAFILLAGLFVKRSFSIKREIVIEKSLQEVFDYVKLLRNQDYYSKWVMTDPQMKKEFRGKDGTVGFVYAWSGNDKAGEGEQEITGISEGRRVDIEIRFVKPFKSVARTPIVTEALTPTQTKVIWGMEGRSKYPFNIMYVFLSNVFGRDVETSLKTLKRNLEEQSTVTVHAS